MNDKTRIDELEVKLAFLDETVATLSDEFYRQQLAHQKLLQEQQKLTDKLQQLEQTQDAEGEIVDDKPPHY